MRALGLAAIAALGWGASTASADADGVAPQAPDPYIYVAPDALPPTWDFTGVYIGAQLGVATNKLEWTINGSFDAARASDYGFAGGAFLGLQKQWNALVVGAEVDYLATGPGDSTSNSIVTNATLTGDVRNILLLSGKFGWAWQNILAYGKGGWASADADFRVATSAAPVSAAFNGRANGWTSGVGIEYAVLPHVSIGVEYDYVALRGGGRTQVLSPLGPAGAPIDLGVDLQTVTARFSYKFPVPTGEVAAVR
jgi:outer membrane immunogenic protein